ncbi:MAG: ATP-binding protein [Lachnospiraceae bacterium]|nr:ATP-binding protein [Lachnospiraceae bacterium]
MVRYNFGYVIEMLLPIIGICMPLNKRKNGLLKGACLLGAILAGNALFYEIMEGLGYSADWTNHLTSMREYSLLLLWFVVIWLAVILFIFLWTEVSFRNAIYLFAISYAVEHIYYCIRIFIEYLSQGVVSEHQPVFYAATLVISFLSAYFWFGKNACKNGVYQIEVIPAASATVVILLVVWGLSIIASLLEFSHIHAIYAILCCIFILINQREQMIQELEREEFRQKEQLWKDTKVRYEISKDAMAVVNQHYHDMKHQINALANMESDERRRGILSEMENDIAVYDAVVRTGNELLDTVLTEKKLICHSKEIQMSCIADGQQLFFMEEMDLYTLLGNALDNAIEANEKIKDKKKRWISLQIQDKKGMKLVEIVNPFEGEIKIKEDEILTSKADSFSHGFGLASIKSITEKYKGQMIIKTENHKFLLRLIF